MTRSGSPRPLRNDDFRSSSPTVVHVVSRPLRVISGSWPTCSSVHCVASVLKYLGTLAMSAPSRVCTSDDSALPYVSAFGWASACAPMVSRIVSAGSAKSTHCLPSMVR